MLSPPVCVRGVVNVVYVINVYSHYWILKRDFYIPLDRVRSTLSGTVVRKGWGLWFPKYGCFCN